MVSCPVKRLGMALQLIILLSMKTISTLTSLIMVPLLILHAVRRESKFDFGHGIIDVATKARIQEEGLPPIQLGN